MSKKKMATLLIASCLGCVIAGPSPAAAAPVMDFSKANPKMSLTGGSSLLTLGSLSVNCTSTSSLGQWNTELVGQNTGSTGTVQLVFKGCLAFGIACTSPGAAAGEIRSETLVFHLVYIKGFSNTLGILFTNNATTGRFAETSCGNITGNGLIAHLSKPKCGETLKTMSLSFESISSGVPRYQQVEGSAVEYHWLYGEKLASADSLLTIAFESEVTATPTCF